MNDSLFSVASICKLLESTFEHISIEKCSSKLLDYLNPIFNSLIDIVMNNNLIIKYILLLFILLYYYYYY